MILGFILLIFLNNNFFDEVESYKSVVIQIDFKDHLGIVVGNNFGESYY